MSLTELFMVQSFVNYSQYREYVLRKVSEDMKDRAERGYRTCVSEFGQNVPIESVNEAVSYMKQCGYNASSTTTYEPFFDSNRPRIMGHVIKVILPNPEPSMS